MGKKKNTAIEAFDETDFSDSAPAFLPDGTHVSARSEGEPRVEYVPLAELDQASWPGNPKAHDIDTIVASIERFGFVSPMLMDEKSQRIVAGHGRVEALCYMREQGSEPPRGVRVYADAWFVPVLRGVDFESEQEAEAYLLADNRLQELGGWDNKRLVEMLGHVENWDGTGYTEDDLTSLLMSLNTAPPPSPDTPFAEMPLGVSDDTVMLVIGDYRGLLSKSVYVAFERAYAAKRESSDGTMDGVFRLWLAL